MGRERWHSSSNYILDLRSKGQQRGKVWREVVIQLWCSGNVLRLEREGKPLPPRVTGVEGETDKLEWRPRDGRGTAKGNQGRNGAWKVRGKKVRRKIQITKTLFS